MQDGIFDDLYRSHLKRVYSYLGRSVPDNLSEPLGKEFHTAQAEPKHLLNPVIDGIETTYYEWKSAGYWYLEEGTAHQATAVLSGFRYGFDLENLYMRFDGDSGLMKSCDEKIIVEVTIVRPKNYSICIELDNGKASAFIRDGNKTTSIDDAEVLIENILEVKIPLESVDLKADERFHFFIRLTMDVEELERLPRLGVIQTRVPSEDFESKRWYV